MIFLIIISIVLALLSTYIGSRMIPPLNWKPRWKAVAWIFVFTPLLFALVELFILSAGDGGLWADYARFGIYVLISVFSLIFFLLLVRDLSLALQKFTLTCTSLFGTKKPHTSQKNSKHDPERRQFLTNALNGGIILLAGGLAGYGGFEALRRPELLRVNVPIAKLPKAFHGFTIALLSDLHINRPRSTDWLSDVVNMVNATKPDIVALTGDLSDSIASRVRNEVAPLRKLSARYGRFYVTGNHEYYTNAEDWIAELKHLGFTVLMSEHSAITHGSDRLLVCGVPDMSGPKYYPSHISSPKLAQEGSRETDVKILLAHRPQSVYEAADSDYDLLVCGHTHGGQFFPWKYAVDLAQPFLSGLHKVENTNIYVSRGTGYWGPPIRLGVPSEVTLLTLVPA